MTVIIETVSWVVFVMISERIRLCDGDDYTLDNSTYRAASTGRFTWLIRPTPVVA